MAYISRTSNQQHYNKCIGKAIFKHSKIGSSIFKQTEISNQIKGIEKHLVCTIQEMKSPQFQKYLKYQNKCTKTFVRRD